jgi:poly(3-hydroxybutyrate) depolymerase
MRRATSDRGGTRRRRAAAGLFLCTLLAPALAKTEKLQSYSIDASGISVSGISAGAYFAVQMQVAYSADIMGVGAIAGGPYFCAQMNLESALTACMDNPNLIDVPWLVQETKNAVLTGTVDPVSHLKHARVWLYSAQNDTVVKPGVVDKLRKYFDTFVGDSSNIKSLFEYPGEHAFITMNYGSECAFLGEPYINDCGFDAAGSILQHIYRDLTPPRSLSKYPGQLLQFDQTEFIEMLYTKDTAGMGDSGYVFVPDQCADKSATCRVHMVFHGCLQSTEFIGDQFVRHTGYNAWGAENGIIIVYPQTLSSTVNPKGCWDWWGFTGMDYACKLGAQMKTMRNMLNRLEGLR